MKLSYKYRIYLNQKQIKILTENFNFCRFLYNSSLEERRKYYKKYNKSVSYNSQSAQLPEIKKIFKSEIENIYSQSLQQILMRLDKGYKDSFRRIKSKSGKAGFPRFKSDSSSFSILFPQCNFDTGGVKKIDNNHIKIYGVEGNIKIRYHRPFEGRCKTVCLKRQSGKYYIILSCDEVPLAPLDKTGKTVALDLGISSFITTDDGTTFHHPKPYQTSKEKLKYLNQKRDNKVKGSKNHKKIKLLISKTNEKITNIREDFQHKVAKQLVRENDVIVIEKLNIKGMMETKGFQVDKNNIMEASWGSFAAKLRYKAERAGKEVIEVNPMNTSKTCSCCGKIKEKLLLSDRVFNCESCGFEIDRDQNAALNILRLGTSHTAPKALQKPSALC